MLPKYEYRNSPIYVGQHKHQGNYPARFHNHLEVMLIKSSQLRVMIDGDPYLLEPGDLYVAFPNVLHAIEAVNVDVIVAIVDSEKYPEFKKILHYNRPNPPVLRAGEFDHAVYDILERMVQLTTGDSTYKHHVLTGYANALLGELLNSLHLVERSTDSSLSQQLILYILQNYTQPITLEHAAQALGYSKFHISRAISGLFGCNFRTLINSYRVNTAQNLLIYSDRSVKQIAQECGFQNQSAFNRIFLQQTGFTPRQYRQQADEPPEIPSICIKP